MDLAEYFLDNEIDQVENIIAQGKEIVKNWTNLNKILEIQLKYKRKYFFIQMNICKTKR